ncbi:MAG: AAA domain-containing protein [Deltaproteobacteria bacterium]|nr:AAA domain-containing protein [Deltaproteobacteria bacterium]
MGCVSKQVFKHFAEFECDRKLFLDLGESDPQWLSPLRELAADPWAAGTTRSGLAMLGKAYERDVYELLTRNRNARYQASMGAVDKVTEAELSPPRLQELHNELTAPGAPTELYLIEHAWTTPTRFVERIFGVSEDTALPLLGKLGALRPDVLVLSSAHAHSQEPIEALEPDGTLRALSHAEHHTRVGITVLDVKHTHEQGVGRGHLIELLYYALALSEYLQKNNLNAHFFVHVDGHGIVPKREITELARLTHESPVTLAVPMVWRDTVHLFESVQKRVQWLWARAPMAVDSVSAKIQAGCGRCPYLEDCKQTHMPTESPEGWDLGLISYLRPDTAEQLRALDFRSVGDVARGVRDITMGSTPAPLYAEIASLELKAKALANQTELTATPENSAGQRMFSIAVPKYTGIDLFFDVESDPTHEVVFALGFLLRISSSPGAAYVAYHNAWWAFWREALTSKEPLAYADLDAALDPGLVSGEAAQRHKSYALFADALRRLHKTSGGKLDVVLAGETKGEHTFATARLVYDYAYVNSDSGNRGGGNRGERKVAERAVVQLFDLLALSQVYEDHVGAMQVTTREDGTSSSWVKGPGFAGFYWSHEQLTHVQDLLERHMPALLEEPKLRDQFLALLDWLAPSDSGVANAMQHRKVFDLREFVEGSVGLPEIINVTWHGIDSKLDPTGKNQYSRRYWAEHFNYMDFAVWHEYLEEEDSNLQREQLDKIVTEIRRKLRGLRKIFDHYRQSTRELIGRNRSQPVTQRDLRAAALAKDMHALAQVWFLYSRLGAAIEDLSTEHARTTFPSRSIAKLEAAEASDLAVDMLTKRFTLRLCGLSTNAKFSEGSHVSLVSDDRRDFTSGQASAYELKIVAMVWRASTQSFELTLEPGSYKTHPLLSGELGVEDGPWFLYETSGDLWSDRLRKLLSRHEVGKSWLGHKLSLDWTLGTENSLQKPSTFEVTAPSVYLFAPALLPTPTPMALPLKTTQHPPPDASQTEAIAFALSSTISCIQGPPGTGKSQTIAALLDEFLLRHEGPARVLVTAFSYPAMLVVLDKIRRATDAHGNPTRAAKTQLVYLRSASRDAIADEPGLAHVFDLVLTSATQMQLDGAKLSRTGKRLDSHLSADFILFANAFSLTKLAEPSKAGKYDYELLGNGFGFDLVLVDEASQVPANQLLASAELVKPFRSTLRFAKQNPPESAWPLSSLEPYGELTLDPQPRANELTRYVIVGDHNQLPPVQPIKPPAKLQRALDSAFSYYVEGHRVAHKQLRRNYRSHPSIVAYTRSLNLYNEGLDAFRADHPFTALPPTRPDVAPWVAKVLDPDAVVSTLIHARKHETSVSPLESSMAAQLAVDFFAQMGVASERDERDFWQEHLGIVSPHNAQGRLIARTIYDRMTQPEQRKTFLSDGDLLQALRSTIYSVEKFQGSDRTLIIGSIALSSRDQLASEEAFIYDLNRFNVLTSRAKQKLVLLCSESFLDYVPRDREVFAFSARVRNFALTFCNHEEALGVTNDKGELEHPSVRWRVHR